MAACYRLLVEKKNTNSVRRKKKEGKNEKKNERMKERMREGQESYRILQRCFWILLRLLNNFAMNLAKFYFIFF